MTFGSRSPSTRGGTVGHDPGLSDSWWVPHANGLSRRAPSGMVHITAPQRLAAAVGTRQLETKWSSRAPIQAFIYTRTSASLWFCLSGAPIFHTLVLSSSFDLDFAERWTECVGEKAFWTSG